MAVNYDVPFVANSKSDLHCWQASLSMLIRNYTDAEPSIEELDIVTGHKPGTGTWPLMGLEYMRSLGIEMLLITPFDYQAFVDDGIEYIRREYGDEVAQWQEQNIDIESDAKMISELLPKVNIEKRNPAYDDIINYLQKHPVICSINSAITRGEDDYTGHFVVIRGYDDDGLFLNDSGLPARENVHVPRELFEKAWVSFSGEHAKFLYPVIAAPKAEAAEGQSESTLAKYLRTE